MSKTRTIMLAIAVVATPMLSFPSEASAGPLLDWIRGCRRPRANACNTCPPVVANMAPNACGLQPGQCMKTCQQTCSRTVVNYVPCTSYRTNWKKVPVTTYKPMTKSDPCTGCTVTCMRPCTTYTYQMQRVPYTTYRPVYNTETYKVPVTTIYNDCATGGCATGGCATGGCATGGCATGGCATGGCASGTCGTSGVYPYPSGGMPNPAPANYSPTPGKTGAPQNYLPTETVNGTYYEYPTSTTVSGGTISTEGGYNRSRQPADIVPSLQGISPQSATRPVLDQLRGVQPDWSTQTARPATYQTNPNPPTQSNSAPSVISYNEISKVAEASSPERREWNYSPIRLASYQSDEATSTRQPIQIRGTFRPSGANSVSTSSNSRSSNDLNGWVEVE